ncbi:hypothetical protein DNU06_17345 [Putridiphycobacter roseus]|uniref:Uncharacterized protein n=1 Tax=Putridiphycobacter roseus TaxID=2219161 RepID=A0A2W1MWQ3_9FLAO|nr:hypothetical protein DNU06_17345 [Putridiphycobacter roseus]
MKNKSEQVTDKVKEKTKKVVDKVFPSFDCDQADTENNRSRFAEFLKIRITPDVKNIYCFDDAIGIDADYMFAFNCNATTSKQIINTHNLIVDTVNSDNGFGMQHDFEWWDKKRIENLQKYSWTDGNQYFKYYWYDSENEKGYYFDFDL